METDNANFFQINSDMIKLLDIESPGRDVLCGGYVV